MEKNGMLKAGQRVVVGLSGGADSVCLLSLLSDMRSSLSIRLRAVHVHHGLRGQEADRDADFSRELCRKLDIPFILKMENAHQEAQNRRISEEEAGRLLRYEAFEQEAARWEEEEREQEGAALPVRIAVAHHGDDSAETILYHLFRGSGLRGLAGIAPVRGAGDPAPFMCFQTGDSGISEGRRPLLCDGFHKPSERLHEKPAQKSDSSHGGSGDKPGGGGAYFKGRGDHRGSGSVLSGEGRGVPEEGGKFGRNPVWRRAGCWLSLFQPSGAWRILNRAM